MSMPQIASEMEWARWLASGPSEDELRECYLGLERRRADLWTPGHVESFRHDRFERDAALVRSLVQVKQALARHWQATGQIDWLRDGVSA
jgi:hypothetical protein